MDRLKNEVVFNLTELHKRLGKIVQTVALSNKHYLVKKGGLPAIVMMSYAEYERMRKEAAIQTLNQAVRTLVSEAERQGLTEEQAVEEMKQIRQQVYQEIYGKSST
jgi:prevent-host-death family protein